MMYQFTCKCGAAFRIREENIGKTATCPKCHARSVLSRETLVALADATPAGEKPAASGHPGKAAAAPHAGGKSPGAVSAGAKPGGAAKPAGPPPMPGASPPKPPATPARPAAPPLPSAAPAPEAAKAAAVRPPATPPKPPAATPATPPATGVPAVRPAAAENRALSEASGTGEGIQLYPWLPDPVLLERAQQLYEQKQVQTYPCRSTECINLVRKVEATSNQLYPLQLEIYSDFVGVDLREEKPGCLAALLQQLPPGVRDALKPVFTVVDAVASILGGGLGCLSLIVVLPLALVLAIPALIVLIPVCLVWMPIAMLLDYLERKRLDAVARKILADPTSSYAVKQLHSRSPLAPCYWNRGEIQQIVRIDTRRGLRKYACLLFVRDNPLPASTSTDAIPLVCWLQRTFNARRRVFLVRAENLDEADRAAESAARVLQAPLVRARYVLFGGHVLE